MSEWWTYGLHDLLLFSPGTYYRLFELHNLEWWPLPLATLALGAALLVLAGRGGERAGRWVLALLAACWLWVAWAWQLQRYAPINWAAAYFAWAWAAQGLLLLDAAWRGRFDALPPAWRRHLGIALAGCALALHPLLASMLGRGWAQAEVFGMAPDPTALFTLGVLLVLPLRRVGWLLAIPLAWCATSGATLWAMASPGFWVTLEGASVAGTLFLVASG